MDPEHDDPELLASNNDLEAVSSDKLPDKQSHSSHSSSDYENEAEKQPPSYPILPSAVPSAPVQHSDSSDSADDDSAPFDEAANPMRRRTIMEKLKSLSDFGIEISVTDPQVRSAGITKHVFYTVVGSDSIGGFQVQRRIKEFRAFRAVLVKEWPGCVVLQLPGKQVIVRNR
jgi:hypothetical protein